MAKSFRLDKEIDLHYNNSYVKFRRNKSEDFSIGRVIETHLDTQFSCGIGLLYSSGQKKGTPVQIHYKVSKKWELADINPPESRLINFDYPFRKYINTPSSSVFLYRKPERQWIWGLNKQNTRVFDLGSPSGGFSNYYGEYLLDYTFFPWPYNVEKSLALLEEGPKKVDACGPEIALKKEKYHKKNNLVIYWKHYPVGILNTDNLTAYLPKHLAYLKPKMQMFENVKYM